jgi:hypothetical protein
MKIESLEHNDTYIFPHDKSSNSASNLNDEDDRQKNWELK